MHFETSRLQDIQNTICYSTKQAKNKKSRLANLSSLKFEASGTFFVILSRIKWITIERYFSYYFVVVFRIIISNSSLQNYN